jgi:hypothetical protein
MRRSCLRMIAALSPSRYSALRLRMVAALELSPSDSSALRRQVVAALSPSDSSALRPRMVAALSPSDCSAVCPRMIAGLCCELLMSSFRMWPRWLWPPARKRPQTSASLTSHYSAGTARLSRFLTACARLTGLAALADKICTLLLTGLAGCGTQ